MHVDGGVKEHALCHSHPTSFCHAPLECRVQSARLLVVIFFQPLSRLPYVNATQRPNTTARRAEMETSPRATQHNRLVLWARHTCSAAICSIVCPRPNQMHDLKGKIASSRWWWCHEQKQSSIMDRGDDRPPSPPRDRPLLHYGRTHISIPKAGTAGGKHEASPAASEPSPLPPFAH
jgi:hypothetical protein